MPGTTRVVPGFLLGNNMFVKERFRLNPEVKAELYEKSPKFGYDGYGEFIFYRTYSRIRKDGGQENWADCVIRVTEGTFSIRKDWYLKNHISWDESFWQDYAKGFARFMFDMYWLPPGRGLWAMGTDFVYERGSMALYNCAYTDLGHNWADDISWLMDCLMHGVGVGFGPHRDDQLELYTPRGSENVYEIPDTREGWCESVRLIINSYLLPGQRPVRPEYHLIREAGLPIRGFGGVSSGPEPLMKLHVGIIESLERYRENKEYDSVRLKTDIANKTGCCVVAGNVRRSAELGCAPIRDQTFMDLKNYEKHPDRAEYGWMSNNAAILDTDEDFDHLGEMARRVVIRGEPGAFNRQNLKYGRIGKKDNVRPDKAVGLNPCGEIPLEDKETCNVGETYPTVCNNTQLWFRASEYCTFYTSTVSLLPTHSRATNRVVARNRRIGVSIVDVSGWQKEHGVYKLTKWMREGYKVVRESNRRWNAEAGVPEAIRVTTIKPGGTTPKLPGRTPGIGNPTFDYTIRRTRVQENTGLDRILTEAGYPRERDRYSDNTVVFEHPIHQGPAAPAEQVSLWEQAVRLAWVAREWADNAVSNTLYFRPKWPKIKEIKEDFAYEVGQYTDTSFLSMGYADDLINDQREVYVDGEHKLVLKFVNREIVQVDVYKYDPNHEEDHIEAVLSATIPVVKSLSLLPHDNYGAYEQMPEQGCTEEEYRDRLASVKKVDWSKFSGSDGIDEQYCSGPVCEIRK